MVLPSPGLPNLRPGAFEEKSKSSVHYNCFAWALGYDDSIWLPRRDLGYYWPRGIDRNLLLNTVIKLFSKQGYKLCDEGSFEDGIEKVAIYVLDGVCKHAARQLVHETWTSKLGIGIDIEHSELKTLEGGDYGVVRQVVFRPRRSDS